MEKVSVPMEPGSPKPVKRRRWERCMIELNGRFGRGYRHDMAALLMQSYSEIGSFPHLYASIGNVCGAHEEIETRYHNIRNFHGISGIDFDNKGHHLVSTTRIGCLTIHNFETLYCQSKNATSTCSADIGTQYVRHRALKKPLGTVRWNIANQDEVACGSLDTGKLRVFNIDHGFLEPVQMLRENRLDIISEIYLKGFSDIVFTSNDISRVFASSPFGWISEWDRRASDFPCLHLMTPGRDFVTTIQLNIENQTIFGASEHGMIYMWDLRGGTTSVGFQRQGEVSNAPFTTINMAEKIGSLEGEIGLNARHIHSIGLDPSCPYQLAFHLANGWSGVLDIYNLSVTHLHSPSPCPTDDPLFTYDWRRASWLPTHSIYAVAAPYEDGIRLLDFFQDASSPNHVDHGAQSCLGGHRQNRFVTLSEEVTSCAAHPLNGTIIAGTMDASLLVLSQKNLSSAADNGEPNV